MFTLKNGVALRVCAILVLVLGGSVFSDTEAQTNWWPEIRLTDDPSASIISGSNARSVAADTEGNICVVWTDYRCGPARVYYKIFDGYVWTPDSALTPANSNGHDPAIAAGDGCLHVVWTDYRHGNAELYYRMFDGTAWGVEQRLTNELGSSLSPSVAADDTGAVHVVWEDYRSGNWEIYYKRGFDETVWTGDERLTYFTSNSLEPSVEVGAGGSVHVVWQDSRDGNREIYYKTLVHYDWTDDERLTVDSDASDTPTITADPAGNLYVFWKDTRDGNSEIYYKMHDGSAWGADERVTFDTGNSKAPSGTATDSSDIHLVWYDDRDGNEEIYYKHLSGATWGPDERLTQAGGESSNPSIAPEPDGGFDIVWQDKRDNNSEVYWKRFFTGLLPPLRVTSIEPLEWPAGEGVYISNLAGEKFFTNADVRLERAGETPIVATDVCVRSPVLITCQISLEGAQSGAWDVVVRNIDGQADTLKSGFNVIPALWSDDTRLTYDPNASKLSKPNGRCVAVDSLGNLHVVWFDTRDGNSEIYYKRFDGISWGPDERITTTGASSEYPALAVDDSNRIHLVWHELVAGQFEVYYKLFDGTTWGPDERLTSANNYSTYPSVAVGAGGVVHVAWQDDRNANAEVYYKRFDGSVWLPDERLTNTESVSGTPAIAVDTNNDVHVIWYEDLTYVGLASELRHLFYDGAWGPVETLATGKDIWTPSITADACGSIHVTWHDRRYSVTDEHEIFYKVFDGLTWGPRRQISDAPGASSNSSVTVGGDSTVYVFWADVRRGDTEIYYRMFDGVAWHAEARLTFADGESRFPSAAVDGDGLVHVIWQDRRNGNAEIYHKVRDPGILSGTVTTDKGIVPLEPVRVLPNPVRTSAHVVLAVPYRSETNVSVYDITGRLVRAWDLGVQAPGRHNLDWDATDSHGRPVAPGVYFLEVATGNRSASAKVIVLR